MAKTIHDYLGVPKTWPIVEKIKHKIVLMPSKEDVKTADKKDPLKCALHNTACRVFNIPNCAIGGRWAYIPQRDAKGKFYIARMQATVHTQKAINKFDKTGEMPEAGFTFVPIAKSHFYKAKRKYCAKWRKEEVGFGTYKKRTNTPRRIKTRCLPKTFQEHA